MISVKCLNCRKHAQKGNRHTCSANINIYVLGTLQEPIKEDCMTDYESIHSYKRRKLRPWRPGDE